MFIDKKDLGLENDANFSGVKGLDCNFSITIEPIGNNSERLAGKLHMPLTPDIADKIKKEVISHYKEDLTTQLLNGKLHIIL